MNYNTFLSNNNLKKSLKTLSVSGDLKFAILLKMSTKFIIIKVISI